LVSTEESIISNPGGGGGGGIFRAPKHQIRLQASGDALFKGPDSPPRITHQLLFPLPTNNFVDRSWSANGTLWVPKHVGFQGLSGAALQDLLNPLPQSPLWIPPKPRCPQQAPVMQTHWRSRKKKYHWRDISCISTRDGGGLAMAPGMHPAMSALRRL